MRIITGRARGVRLDTLQGDLTRPTSERSKEAIFSMLQFEIANSAVLDLFSGSGQLGLEAASRGASLVHLVERDRGAFDIISKNLKKCRLEDACTVYRDDSIAFLKKQVSQKYDIVFLDPPYATDLINEALEVLLERKLLNEGAFLVCESDRSDVLNEKNSASFDLIKTLKHGIAYISVLKSRREEQ